MSRRGFVLIWLLLAAFLPAVSLTGAQQPKKIWRIGSFHVGLDHVPPSFPALREALKALGYEEGKNIHLDWRNLPDEEAARRSSPITTTLPSSAEPPLLMWTRS
ncbi:MAG: hypothetical protein HY695_30885 [Deltaproteobacteria bacterium]|nr:hypothetical protein [Deltaproteobacteria bacterium]